MDEIFNADVLKELVSGMVGECASEATPLFRCIAANALAEVVAPHRPAPFPSGSAVTKICPYQSFP